MIQTDPKKDRGVEHERVSHSKSGSRSHHVELVLARIFAKQREYTKQEAPRQLDWENVGTDWH
jgi:hypothetical protein